MKAILKSFCLIILGVISLFFVACSEDDDEVSGQIDTSQLIGTWTAATATLQEATVNGEDFSSFLNDFRQVLIDFGLSPEEVDELIAEIEAELEDGAVETYEGTVTFNADGTYQSVDPEETINGTWKWTNNNTSLLIDEGTDDEVVLDVVSLTSNRFEAVLTEIDQDDIDGDGTNDEVRIVVSIVFTR